MKKYGQNKTSHEALTDEYKAEDDMGAYLFVHFVGSERTADSEQIYSFVYP